MSDTDTAEQIIEWIESRRSIGNLNIPAPTDDQIKKAIHCAITAPDHKKLKPWRFVVTKGNARHNMGKALLAAAEAQATRNGTELDDRTKQKTYQMPLRAPVIITVVTRMQYHEKVPEFEQLLSTGACIQNLILALQAQEFACVWRTGLLCNEPEVKRYFNVGSDDYVAGFIYVGTPYCAIPKRSPIEIEELVTFEG